MFTLWDLTESPKSELFQKFQTLASSQFPPIRDEETNENCVGQIGEKKSQALHRPDQARDQRRGRIAKRSIRKPQYARRLAVACRSNRFKSPFQVASVRTNESELSELHNLESDLLGQFRSVEENLAYLTDAGLRSQLASTKLLAPKFDSSSAEIWKSRTATDCWTSDHGISQLAFGRLDLPLRRPRRRF